MGSYVIDIKDYKINEVESIARSNVHISLSQECWDAILICRSYLDDLIEGSDELIYGINTGFGSLCNTAISKSEMTLLQTNLVKSHACGLGSQVPNFIVKRMLLLKIISLSKGYSGISKETIERLIFFYNHEIYPVIYEQGSLGASGDLAPLAHMSLPLIGLGEVMFKGKIENTSTVYEEFSLYPLELKSKEGLALLNGTQFMCAYAMYCIESAKEISNWANYISCLSLEAFDCKLNPFFENVNAIRKQQGQITVARKIREILSDSITMMDTKPYVQDPYSFRCIPQVHGASLDTIEFVSTIIEREINAVTDNPTIFYREKEVISGGNFHGQPIALTMDFLSIALAELGSISERRTYKLLSGTRGLPAFLVKEPGLNSGLMIAQYSCASIVSQNKQLANPSSIDTIDSSNGQEDHVSMGANAATKLLRVVHNCQSILGIELLSASQALEFRDIDKMSNHSRELLNEFRNHVPFIEKDVVMSDQMKKSVEFVCNDSIKMKFTSVLN